MEAHAEEVEQTRVEFEEEEEPRRRLHVLRLVIVGVMIISSSKIPNITRIAIIIIITINTYFHSCAVAP